MTEFNMKPSRDCIGEYISFSVFENKGQKALRLALFLSVGLIALIGVTLTVMTGQPLLLLITLAAVLTGIAYPLLTRFALKDSVNRLSESLEREEPVNAAVSEMNLLFLRNGLPAGILEWSEITEIHEGKTGFFLKTAKDTLLLLARDSVVSGTYDEAAQVMRGKKEKLAEKGEASPKEKEKANEGKKGE